MLVRLGDPQVDPCFHCLFLPGMPPSMTTGSPSVAYTQLLHRQRWPSPRVEQLGTPVYPSSASDGFLFSWLSGSRLLLASLRPVELLALLADLTGVLFPANEGFYFRAFDESVTLLAAGYDFGVN